MLKLYFQITALLFITMRMQAQSQSNYPPKSAVVLLSNDITANADSYAPFRYGDKVYFTTLHASNNQKRVSRIFSTYPGEKQATLLPINPQKEELHAANLTMTSDGATLFYSLCQDNTQNKCTIWSRKKRYEGGWEAASKLPPHINKRNSTATQPTIGYDWELNKYVLYFVSNRPGGKGGKDIWQSVIETDGTYNEPTSLPFNTAGDEVSPYFHLPEKTLFFSSNELPGAGGFDVFSTKKTVNGKWEYPMNSGTILNSQYDETHFTFHASSKKGYFASNRPTYNYSKNPTHQKSITRIYEVNTMVELTLPVFDANNKDMVHGATAVVYDKTSRERLVFKEGPFDTNLKVALLPDRVYRISVLTSGYIPAVMEVSTEGVVFPISLEQEVQLFMDEGVTDNMGRTHNPQPK